MAEAYGQLPFEGGILRQPIALLEAFGIIRQTRAGQRMREARERELAWKSRAGGNDG